MSNEEIIELIKDAAFFGGTIKDKDAEECKAFLDNLGYSKLCQHKNEVMRQGDGFVYVVCGDCNEEL